MIFQKEVREQSNVLRAVFQQINCFELPRKYQLKKKTDREEKRKKSKSIEKQKNFASALLPMQILLDMMT